MPVVTDPNIVKATVALKRSQTRLTTLRRRHLQGDYIEKKVFEKFVLGLAHELRAELLSLPGLIRRTVKESEIKDGWQLEDAIERAVDSWMLAYSTRPIPLPAPVRSKSGYTTKPGPRVGSKRRAKVNGAPVREAAP